ncbi:uncharacterized protein LOC109539402 [Dendroctonus ponderosae]|uniref:uncharacterized protein LOC109539402 n=1 Tax=Dendroctonus ponderosae TaxID=77166 RepID=UPI0020358618|nr:uncharacterized protein LOC109539402 [Dendroctonus ponderosae]
MSSLPIRMTIRGFPICGRCHDSEEFKDVSSAISRANFFVTHFEFFCINTLDGCLVQDLKPAATTDHEAKCKVPQLDCVFCSFKGNILQIIHHSVRQHRMNLSLDGVIEFSLKENTEKKTTLMVIHGVAFVLKWQISKEKVVLKFKLLVNLPFTQHYRIHFSRKGDAELPLEMLNEYGVISMKCDTCIDISKPQLKLKFGEEAILMCKISFEEVSVERKIEECKEREAKCQPDALIQSINESQVNTDLKASIELCNSVSKLLKTFAHRLLKCVVCKQIAAGDSTHFCPELHGCCNKCWTGYCSECSEVRPYRDIPMLENLVVDCDWDDCAEETKFYKYLTHKASCPQRPYKCPLKNCNEIRVGVPALTNHWHVELPDVVVGNVYEFNKQFIKTEYAYWIHQGDIYVVTINLEETYLDVLLEEVDVIPNCNLDKLSCSLLLGDKTYDIPIVRTYCKCEGKFVYSEKIPDFKPENKHMIVVINMNPEVPYQRSRVSVPVQRKPKTFITV